MTIRLVSGLPGSGKSLRGVWLVREAVATGRPVYVDGLDGLQEFGWEHCDANRWQDLPDGSLVVLDEAQKKWGTRRTAEPPEHIRALSEHRHRGFDFVLITQHPTMLDAYVRKLINGHEHLVRQFGAQVSKVIGWQECQDDPQSQGTRDRGTMTVWRYPHELFPLYKSATMHTVKHKLPVRVLAIPLIVVTLLGLGWYGFTRMGSIEKTATKSNDGIAAKVFGGSGNSQAIPRSAEEYIARITPRVQGMPWSAPLFDDRKPKAEPDVYCVSIEHQSCRCYSEEITPITVDQLACQQIAKHGVYNPYREPLVAGKDASSSDDKKNGRGSGYGDVLKPGAHSADPASLGSGDLKVIGASGEGGSSWPRPDFSYKVPFPSVGGAH